MNINKMLHKNNTMYINIILKILNAL